MKKTLSLALSLLMLVSIFTSCNKTDTGIYTPGTYEGVATGFGGPVTVSIEVDAASIKAVNIAGDDETKGIGDKAVTELAPAILKAGSAEVDVVAGATVTSNAIKAAANAAIGLAKGETPVTAATMAAGTYTASAQGFAKQEQLGVTVTVSENAIESIVVDEDNGETQPILDSVIELMLPRMIENQTLDVDAIAGATVSSNAVKIAVADCVAQAIAAAGGEASSINAFNVAIAKSTSVIELDTDVLVIGMGGSGITAAMSAVQEQYEAAGKDASKVSVLGIDKAGKLGGTSAITSSPMSVNQPSKVAANGGVEFVDADALRADWYEYTKGDAKEEMIDIIINYSGETMDWLESYGFNFGAPEYGFGTPYKVVSYYGGSMGANKDLVGTYFDALSESYTKMGGKYMLETEGTDLILDSNGKVVGAKAVGADGTQYTINAKAVILAGGGFAGNAEMQEKYLSNEYYPLKGSWNLYGMAQNDGKTIQMALNAGAGTYNISVPPMVHIGGTSQIMHAYEVHEIEGEVNMWTGRTATWSLNDIPMVMAVAPDSMAVNSQGVRFTDESGLAMMNPWLAGPNFYSIWSDARIAEIAENGFEYVSTGLFINQGGVPANTAMPEIYDVLDTAIKMGYVYKADTLEELATFIGCDAQTLTASVESYNAYCETGVVGDEIEKSAFVTDIMGNALADANYCKTLGNEGPYYVVVGASWCYSTAGGLDVNENMQVLKEDGTTPIEGLYAVGTDTIGVLLTEQKEYVKYGGAAQGWAFTSGKLAGAYAAQNIAK